MTLREWTWLAAAAALAACACRGTPATPEQRAADACRIAISRNLVDPVSARYDNVTVSPALGTTAWQVSVDVSAKSESGEVRQQRVSCQVADGFEVLELGSERDG